jgi:hypothetical protein
MMNVKELEEKVIYVLEVPENSFLWSFQNHEQ